MIDSRSPLVPAPDDVPVPGRARPAVVVPAPGPGEQRWAGAPSAVPHPDGGVALAYRLRFDLGSDRNVLAWSADGVRTETVAEIDHARWGLAMVERPALVRTGDGWRLFVSGSDPATGRWSVGVVAAADLAGLAVGELRPVFPGNPRTTVKDPVVRVRDGRWHAWLCCHPLDVPGAEDRMTTAYATSADGVRWRHHGTVLTGTPGTWDARGARLTCVLPDGRALYDGRASAAENWWERTGVAAPRAGGPAGPVLDPVAGPVADARYAELVAGPHGDLLYYEAPLADGSHELRVEAVTGPA